MKEAVNRGKDAGGNVVGEMPKQQATALNSQREHWERTFASSPGMFGDEPSYPAQKSASLFKAKNKLGLLELGGGQGRDSVFYAREGFDVTALDCSDAGLREIQTKACGKV